MSDVDRALHHLERVHRLLDMRSKWIKSVNLEGPEKLQEAIQKLNLLVSKQQMARISEFRASVLNVAMNPRLDRAQKVAQLASHIEKLEGEGVIRLKGQKDLVGLGIVLIAFPEPTMVSDVLGLMLVAVGLVLQKKR